LLDRTFFRDIDPAFFAVKRVLSGVLKSAGRAYRLFFFRDGRRYGPAGRDGRSHNQPFRSQRGTAVVAETRFRVARRYPARPAGQSVCRSDGRQPCPAPATENGCIIGNGSAAVATFFPYRHELTIAGCANGINKCLLHGPVKPGNPAVMSEVSRQVALRADAPGGKRPDTMRRSPAWGPACPAAMVVRQVVIQPGFLSEGVRRRWKSVAAGGSRT